MTAKTHETRPLADPLIRLPGGAGLPFSGAWGSTPPRDDAQTRPRPARSECGRFAQGLAGRQARGSRFTRCVEGGTTPRIDSPIRDAAPLASLARYSGRSRAELAVFAGAGPA